MHKSILLLFIGACLVGCGSDDSAGSDKPDVKPLFGDLFIVEQSGVGIHSISLGALYNPEGDLDINVVSVEDSKNESVCNVTDFNSTELKIENSALGACQFEVKLKQSDNSMTYNTLAVNFRTTEASINDPIPTQSILVAKSESTTIDFNTHEVLSAFFPVGTTIKDVQVFGDATVSSTTSTIRISASNNTGLNRILYTLERQANSVVVDSRIGVIDFTVTNSDHIGPSVLKQVVTRQINTRESVDINLLTGPDPIVNKGNAENLHIVNLYSVLGGAIRFGTWAEPVDPNSQEAMTSNTSFNFRTDNVGSFPVTYTVSDHKGGFATGSVVFTAGFITSPNTPLANSPGRMLETVMIQDEDLKLTQLMSRPRLSAEVVSPVNAVTINNEDWALLTRTEAQSYCRAQGLSLPTSEALKNLILNSKMVVNSELPEGDPDRYEKRPIEVAYGWPDGEPDPRQSDGSTGNGKVIGYLALESDLAPSGSSGKALVNSLTGELIANSADSRGLVTCVLASPPRTVQVSTSNINLSGDSPSAPEASKKVTIGDENNLFNDLRCTSSDPTITVTGCTSSTKQITIAGGPALAAQVTVATNGETIIGLEEPAVIAVRSSVNDVAPRVTHVRISTAANHNETLVDSLCTSASSCLFGNFAQNEAQRKLFRPAIGSTSGPSILGHVSLHNDDRDAGVLVRYCWYSLQDGKRLNCADLPYNAPGLIQEGVLTANVTTPGRGYILGVTAISALGTHSAETRLNLPFDFTNPEISGINVVNIVPAVGGFGPTDKFNIANPYNDYTDANNDPEVRKMIQFETKKQNESIWKSISNVTPVSDFHNNGSSFEGQDLRVSVSVEDQFGSISGALIEQYYPSVSSTEKDPEVWYREAISSSPLGFKHFGTTNLTIRDDIERVCRVQWPYDRNTKASSGRIATISELNMLTRDIKRPRYYGKNYSEFNVVPAMNGNNLVWVNLDNGSLVNSGGKRGLLCAKGDDRPTKVSLSFKRDQSTPTWKIIISDEDGVSKFSRAEFSVTQLEDAARSDGSDLITFQKVTLAGFDGNLNGVSREFTLSSSLRPLSNNSLVKWNLDKLELKQGDLNISRTIDDVSSRIIKLKPRYSEYIQIRSRTRPDGGFHRIHSLEANLGIGSTFNNSPSTKNYFGLIQAPIYCEGVNSRDGTSVLYRSTMGNDRARVSSYSQLTTSSGQTFRYGDFAVSHFADSSQPNGITLDWLCFRKKTYLAINNDIYGEIPESGNFVQVSSGRLNSLSTGLDLPAVYYSNVLGNVNIDIGNF